MFQDAIAGGLAAIRQAAGVPITIRSGGAEQSCTAAIRETEFTTTGQDGLTVLMRVRTYLIGVADYAFDGIATEPQTGHRIIQSIQGEEREFEVVGPNGQAPFGYTDNDQSQYEVYTVQVG